MSYFLKKTKSKNKGFYLQIYESNYISREKGSRNKSYQAIGYELDLMKKGIKNPLLYAQDLVDKLNGEDIQINETSIEKNLGYFLLKAQIDKLKIDDDMLLMSKNKKFNFLLSDFVKSMIYAQILCPGSKYKAYENVIPSIFNGKEFSYDQILHTINYIGSDYEKFIELFNRKISDAYNIDTSKILFDCTNYYFEIDLPFEDKQKGPSKENRNSPIIGQALMLDKNQIPIGMLMYPGNESEKPKIRETIENMKNRFDIEGQKVIQVADKGLNCAKNIFAATKEANDGYIFSKSIKGRNLSKQEKNWLFLDNDQNRWYEVKNEKNELIYKYKECVDVFNYEFIDDFGELISFSVKEKRVLTYNPSLAKKKILEINKEVEKARKVSTIKQASKDDFGDSLKYVTFESKDEKGKKIKIKALLNEEAIERDKQEAGFNLLVTSEVNMTAKEIYEAYHALWKIEESFKILKTYLEARPVFLQNKESIYGHFLICYLSLCVLRLLEIKEFENQLSTPELIGFIRRFNIVPTKNGNEFINELNSSNIVKKIKAKTGLSKISSLYLTLKQVKQILNYDL